MLETKPAPKTRPQQLTDTEERLRIIQERIRLLERALLELEMASKFWRVHH